MTSNRGFIRLLHYWVIFINLQQKIWLINKPIFEICGLLIIYLINLEWLKIHSQVDRDNHYMSPERLKILTYIHVVVPIEQTIWIDISFNSSGVVKLSFIVTFLQNIFKFMKLSTEKDPKSWAVRKLMTGWASVVTYKQQQMFRNQTSGYSNLSLSCIFNFIFWFHSSKSDVEMHLMLK